MDRERGPRKRHFQDTSVAQRAKREKHDYVVESYDHLSGSSVAPWICREEWVDVYRELKPVLNDPANTEGLRRLNVDRVRKIITSCWTRAWGLKNEVPQTTIILIQALLSLRDNHGTALLSAQMAIIRFVKTVSEPIIAKYSERPPIMKVCKILGVPDWIVRIRHEGSHGEMQDAGELDNAICFALQWLKTKVWDVEEQRILDPSYMIKSAEDESDFPTDTEMETVIEDDLSVLVQKIEVFQAKRELRDRHFPRHTKKQSRNERRMRAEITADISDLRYYYRCSLDVFTSVLASRYLSPANVLPDYLEPGYTENEPGVLSELSKLRYGEIVKTIMNCPLGISSLLLYLAKMLGDDDQRRDELTYAWIVHVINRIPRNKVSAVRTWDAFDWRKIIAQLVHKPSRFTELALKKMAPWIANRRDRQYLSDCRQLAALGMPRNQPVVLGNVSTESQTQTRTLSSLLQETKNVIQRSSSTVENVPNWPSSWSLAKDVDWENVPIGILPWQNKPNFNLFANLLLPEQPSSQSLPET